MLAGTLLLTAALIQAAPPGASWPSDHDPVAVEGRVELSPAEADASARSLAEDQMRWDLERRGSTTLIAARPFWLPGFVGDGLLADWLRRAPVDRVLDVVDASREERDHGSYVSYRTTLHVTTDEAAVDRMLDQLRRRIEVGGRRFAWVLGGTAGLWALLTLVYGWMDRLTRGYMPWRLRLVCVGMGLAAPGIALLFV